MSDPAVKDFAELRGLAHASRVIGIVLVLAGLALMLRTASSSWDIKESWMESVGTFVFGVGSFAAGELTLLFLQIEKNTRKGSQ